MEFIVFSEIAKNRSLLSIGFTQRSLDHAATQRKSWSFGLCGVETSVRFDRAAISDLCECKSFAVSPCFVLGRKGARDRNESRGRRRVAAGFDAIRAICDRYAEHQLEFLGEAAFPAIEAVSARK